ncbi:Hsp70 family protein [Nocardioides sp. W7]|uniref:Hsp70 family protein n=1 Tax=Nocardioides sp. W7 TaxID=2931390 RepID=UPI001FCF91D2|nr:Hsp70 family protein [Nocardioides sp. W7]
MSDTVYGIDLGTTYSALARINELGQAEVVPNFEGEPATPSVVYFEGERNVVVGAEAKRTLLSDPDNACALVKRHMGTEHPLEFQGRSHGPESISALILGELVRTANNSTGSQVDKVVITVPAYFGIQAREATRQAGAIAGLEVVGIVTEPVAAALSAVRGEQQQTVLIYDLGGGTFDTTVLQIGPGEADVIAIDGNRLLGGADWDLALVDLIIRKFSEQSGASAEDAHDNDLFMAEVRGSAEETKKALTRREQTTVRCRLGQWDEQVVVTRAEFEQATRDLVTQTLDISQRVVAKAQEKRPGLTIDQVLLVGGSSRMPMIGAALRDQLGWTPVDTDFDLAVAKGAAIYGQAALEEVLTTDADEPAEVPADAPARPYLRGARSLNVSNVLSRGLGVYLIDSQTDEPMIEFLVHANDSLPATPPTLPARTRVAQQPSVRVRLFEQVGERESRVPGENRELKAQELPLPPMDAGAPIEITLEVTSEGLARVQAFDPTNGGRIDFEVLVAQLDQEQVDKFTEEHDAITLRS